MLGCSAVLLIDRPAHAIADHPLACAQVLDMFGCGLPVCAASYDCIRELVADGDNGLLFSGPKQLAQQLAELLAGAAQPAQQAGEAQVWVQRVP